MARSSSANPPRRPGQSQAFPEGGLLAPRVSTLSKALTRSAVQFAKAEYGLAQVEWQVVTLLSVFQPVSIRELAYHAMLDAAQISRAVSSLVARGDVNRARSARDSREAELSLTPQGLAMHAELTAAAQARNRHVLEGHSAADVARFFTMLDGFIARARQLGDQE